MLSEYKFIVLLFIILLIFGPSNLPKLAEALGRSVRELKKGMAGITDDIRDGVHQPAQAPPVMQPPPNTYAQQTLPPVPSPIPVPQQQVQQPVVGAPLAGVESPVNSPETHHA